MRSGLESQVVTWSTFIAGLVNVKDPVVVTDSESGDSTDASDDADKMPRFFHLIKATGDLLMLPKDILMDKGIRKEVQYVVPSTWLPPPCFRYLFLGIVSSDLPTSSTA